MALIDITDDMSSYQIPLGAAGQVAILYRVLASRVAAAQNPAAHAQLAELRLLGGALSLMGPKSSIRPCTFRLRSGYWTAPLLIGALACHLAINSGLGLLLRNAGGDPRFLAIDVAKANTAISPSWPRRERLAIYLRHARPSGPAATSAAPPRNKKPNCRVRFKSQPPCSVIRRGLARRVGSTEPVARRTTRRQPRSHRPDVRP